MQQFLRYYFLTTLLFLLVLLYQVPPAYAQSTSNSGTNFWVTYTGHIDGTNSRMSLYLTSTVNTTATVSIPLLNYTASYTITANTVTIANIPSTAYVGTSEQTENKGILVTAEKPIVVYSHIFAQNRSGATLVLPTSTLGREYYAATYPPDQNNQYAQFTVVATEDNTTVEITPRDKTLSSRPAKTPFRVTLNKGQVYQVQSPYDLTGSKIISVSQNGQACKRIAVFSGNTFVGIGCANATSRDNLYQQLYPLSTWGKNFLLVPFKTRASYIFRVVAAEDNTKITTIWGTHTLISGGYLQIPTNEPIFITADKPVSVAQYALTQNCDNVTGDPEMIMVNPMEQTLEEITVYSSPFFNITGHYINIIIKTADAPNFRLDNAAVTFTPFLARPGYSYAQVTVAPGNHTLKGPGGFIATAYGFGNVESYGYAAGANIKSLEQSITADKNTFCGPGTVNFQANVSYTPSSILWRFGDNTTSNAPNPSHTFTNPGKYLVQLITIKPNATDCDSKDSTTYEVTVNPLPNAGLGPDLTLCSGDKVNLGPPAQTGITYAWSPATNLSAANVANPQFTLINTTGATVTQQYTLTATHTQTGCVSTDQVTVAVRPAVTPDAGPDVSFCSNQTASVGLPALPGYTYQWLPATGLANPAAAQTTLTLSNTTDAPVIYQYTRNATLNGCTVSDVVQVTVNPLPKGTILGSRSVCPNVTGVAYNIENPQNFTYTWGVKGGTIASNTGTAVTVNWGNTNAKALVYAIPTNPFNCTGDSIKFNVIVNRLLIPEKPKGSTLLCRNVKTNILYTTPNTQGSVYTWGIKGGQIAAGQGTSQVRVNWNESGKGKLWITESSTTATDACSGVSDTLYFKLIPNTTFLEIISVGTEPANEKNIIIRYNFRTQDAYPANKTINLQRKLPATNAWQTIAALPIAGGQYTDATAQTADTQYEYRLEGTNTCDSVLLSLPHPSILLRGNANEPAAAIKLEANPYTGWPTEPVRYEVYKKVEEATAFTLDQTLTASGPTVNINNAIEGFAQCYRIRAVAGTKESWSNSICFEFENAISVPNIITPNGDGKNDALIVKNLRFYPGSQLKIYNRWGQEVFKTDDYTNSWNADELTPGTYYYLLTTKIRPKAYKGWIEVVK